MQRKVNIGRESEHLGCRWLTQAKRKGNKTADVTLMADELSSAAEHSEVPKPVTHVDPHDNPEL